MLFNFYIPAILLLFPDHGLLKRQALTTCMWFFVFKNWKHCWTKYFIYSYILVRKGICEYLMNITQIMGKIWTLLLLWISLKITRWRHQNYCYFCIVKEDTRSYSLAKFRYNCRKQWGNMDTFVWLKGNKWPSAKVGITQRVNSIT